jgi:ABC-type transport system involved in multi-copper enzyme maturation permease subunit
MRVFFTLLQKEISAGFKNGSAYWIFLIYLLVSIGTAFYFSSFLTMRDMALYALFSPQPIILAVLIPALTMRTWTSEYRLGTDEFLLTLPISDTILVAAKICAVWLLLSIMSLFLLPFIFYTSTWLHLDWSNLLLCWVGLELVFFMFSSLGCLISCLCRQLTAAYLISVLILGLLTSLSFSGLYSVYKDFLFAEISLADILYFVLSGCGFFILNIFALALYRSGKKQYIWRMSAFAILFLIGLSLSIIALFYLFPNKIDLTGTRTYSLKPQTLDIIKNTDQAITIDIYAAKDYLKQNPDNRFFFEQINRMVKKYQLKSAGQITVRSQIVEAFSDEEENILQKGLFFEENIYGSRNYFGAILRLNDGTETAIRQFLPQRRQYVEKDVDTAILKLTQPEKIRSIGVYLDGQQNLDPFVSMFVNLENDYNVVNIEDNIYRISDKLDLLILVNPKKLPSVFLYAIDQYIMRGGKLIIFFDFLTRSQSLDNNKKDLDIVSFFPDWGIELQKDLPSEGELASQFITGRKNLNIFNAAEFAVNNKNLQVEPFITNGKNYIGAILKGKIRSHYEHNPFADTNPSLRLLPYTELNENAQIALVGDVDLLDEKNWVSPQSSDRNPYSIIPTSANGEAARALVDYMAGNSIYINLPINNNTGNEQNISEQMMQLAQKVYQHQIAQNNENLEIIRAALYLKTGGDENKLRQMLQISSAGQELAKAEQQKENLAYLVQNEYTKQTHRALLSQIIIIPIFCLALLWGILRRRNKHRQKQISEIFHE